MDWIKVNQETYLKALERGFDTREWHCTSHSHYPSVYEAFGTVEEIDALYDAPPCNDVELWESII